MPTALHRDSTLVLLNPLAGMCRTHPGLVQELDRIAGARAVVRTTHDERELQHACEEAAAAGVRRVACVGGDGTASAVVTALWRAYAEQPLPQLALLRGGTMNTVANSLGVPRRPPAALLQRWLTRSPSSCKRRPLQIGQRLGFLFGVGVFPNWLALYYRAGDGAPTPRTAAQLISHTALSALCGGSLSRQVMEPVAAGVRTERECWSPGQFIGIMAGAVEHVGLGFRLFPHARRDPEHVDLVLLRGPGRQLATALPMVYLRGKLPPQVHDQRLVQGATLTPSGAPFTYSIDGDLFTCDQSLSLSRGPQVPIALLR